LKCQLDHIPSHLHTNNKPVIKKFKIGEELYYRCKPDECKRPYDKISLYEISHNRNFGNRQQYPKKDVLINIIENDPSKVYDSKIVTLKITKLSKEETFSKELISQSNPSLKARLNLLHAPLPCMYPHSVFEITINGTVINKDNYSSTLGKKNVSFKNLRSDIRQELTSIIQTGIIDPTQDIEFLEEL
jgi:hypothetical protein